MVITGRQWTEMMERQWCDDVVRGIGVARVVEDRRYMQVAFTHGGQCVFEKCGITSPCYFSQHLSSRPISLHSIKWRNSGRLT